MQYPNGKKNREENTKKGRSYSERVREHEGERDHTYIERETVREREEMVLHPDELE